MFITPTWANGPRSAATTEITNGTVGCIVADRSEIRGVPAWRALKLRAVVSCAGALGSVVGFGLDKQGRVVCTGRGFVNDDGLVLTLCGVTL